METVETKNVEPNWYFSLARKKDLTTKSLLIRRQTVSIFVLYNAQHPNINIEPVPGQKQSLLQLRCHLNTAAQKYSSNLQVCNHNIKKANNFKSEKA